MIFEVGKCYRHTTGFELSIVCKAETTMFGEVLIAEHNEGIDFIAVGSDEASAENYIEITRDEWMKNFGAAVVIKDCGKAYCPSCDADVHGIGKVSFCPKCKQKLEWR